MTTIKEWSRRATERTDAVIKTAVQDMVRDMQQTRALGGNMPVDTGFLRNSASADGEPVALALMRWSPTRGESFTFGWSAEYAKYMNARYGFRDLPLQKWPQYMAAAQSKVQR